MLLLMTCKALSLIHYIGTYKRINNTSEGDLELRNPRITRGVQNNINNQHQNTQEADSNVRYTTRGQYHRMGVGFSEGQSLLPFYADSGRKATFTILCQFQARRFYRFTAFETEFFSAGALRAPGKPPHTRQPEHSPPSPPPSPGAPAHPCQRRLPRDYHASFSTASRSMAASCAAASRAASKFRNFARACGAHDFYHFTRIM